MRYLPWAPDAILFWRLDKKTRAPSWDTGKGAESVGGRWNPKGYAVVYGSVDPSTAVLEVAVHNGFDALDAVPHVLTCAEILDVHDVHVVEASTFPNSNWLAPGTPGHSQQLFGKSLLQQHPFIAIQSAVLPQSWNLIFNPVMASSKYKLRSQEPYALDTRLNPPVP